MTETLANGYSYDSTQRGLSNEYQHDMVYIIAKYFYDIVPRTKSRLSITRVNHFLYQLSKNPPSEMPQPLTGGEKISSQGLSQDLETGCPKLAKVKFEVSYF